MSQGLVRHIPRTNYGVQNSMRMQNKMLRTEAPDDACDFKHITPYSEASVTHAAVDVSQDSYQKAS
jgi:hypothetical protein